MQASSKQGRGRLQPQEPHSSVRPETTSGDTAWPKHLLSPTLGQLLVPQGLPQAKN